MVMEKQRPGAEARPEELSTFGGVEVDNTGEQGGAQRCKRRQTLDAILHDDHGEHVIPVEGRVAWALRHLIEAGEEGCTPITTPGPRWSDYVFKLRRAGISIETIHEAHGGPYAGHHGRYVLRSRVTLREPVRSGRRAA